MASLNQNNPYDLLRQIKSDDIEILISDLELLDAGYVINYIIDPYDIFRFSFPYGLSFDQPNRSLDEIGDEMIGYSFVFDNYLPIILDEYKLELRVNRKYSYGDFPDLPDSSLFKELEEKLKSGDEETIDETYLQLAQSATFLLSTALLTKSFVNHLDSNFRKLQIDDFKLNTENPKQKKIIQNAFRKNKKSASSKESFQEWVKEQNHQILQVFSNTKRSPWSEDAFTEWVKEKDEAGLFKDKNQSEISTEFRNTYRDFVVIDRICSINKALQESSKSNGNFLFLYFSSADKSTKIFERDKIKSHLPVVYSKNKSFDEYNILRNIKHAYLLFLFSDENRVRTIENLRRLEMIAKKEEGTELAKLTDEDEALFNTIKNKRRGRLEEDSVQRQINTHETYQKSLGGTIQRLERNKGNLRQLKALYEDLLAKAKDVEFSINPLTNMAIDYSIQSSLSILVRLLSGQAKLNLHQGLDLIEGNYQHLPILLFLDKQSLIDRQLEKLLREVIDYVVKSPHIRKEKVKVFFDKIKSLYTISETLFINADKEYRADLYYSGILIKSLIYLMLPSNGEVKNQERETYTFIKDTFAELKLADKYQDLRLTDAHKILVQREYSFRKWEYDYRYFLMWSARRNLFLDESLKEAEEAIKRNPFDPRFHHGKCLALHNKYTIDNLSIDKPECLEPLIETAETAIALYKQKESRNETYKKIIDGSIISLQNTVLYAVLLSYLDALEKGSRNTLLAKAQISKYSLEHLRKNLFDPIQDFERGNKQNAQDFPELAHTKAVLELCESLFNFRSGKIDKAVNSITLAHEAIERALKQNSKSVLYEDTKEKIKSWENIILKT